MLTLWKYSSLLAVFISVKFVHSTQAETSASVDVDSRPTIEGEATRTVSDESLIGQEDTKRAGGHNYLHFGKRLEDKRGHSLMHFGKRDFTDEDKRGHSLMHFGKRDFADEDKRGHSLMHFGKRDFTDEDKRGHSLMHFGKRDFTDEDKRGHSLMHFGKRDEAVNHEMEDDIGNPDDTKRGHSLMHFGKRDDNFMGKTRWRRNVDDYNNAAVLDLLRQLFMDQKDGSKRGHTIMRFGKRSTGPGGHTILRFGKRSAADENEEFDDDFEDEDSFEKRGTHAHMHFGKRDKAGHKILSFGKRYLDDDPPQTIWDADYGEGLDEYSGMLPEDYLRAQLTGEPEKKAHTMIHFGKRGNAMMHFGKRGGVNGMMHFGKRDWYEVDNQQPQYEDLDDKRGHNILHFGKREVKEEKVNHSEETTDKKQRQRRSVNGFYGEGEWTGDVHPSFLLPNAFSGAEANPFQVPLFLSNFNHIQRAAFPFYRSSRAADKKKNVFLHFGRR